MPRSYQRIPSFMQPGGFDAMATTSNEDFHHLAQSSPEDSFYSCSSSPATYGVPLGNSGYGTIRHTGSPTSSASSLSTARPSGALADAIDAMNDALLGQGHAASSPPRWDARLFGSPPLSPPLSPTTRPHTPLPFHLQGSYHPTPNPLPSPYPSPPCPHFHIPSAPFPPSIPTFAGHILLWNDYADTILEHLEERGLVYPSELWPHLRRLVHAMNLVTKVSWDVALRLKAHNSQSPTSSVLEEFEEMLWEQGGDGRRNSSDETMSGGTCGSESGSENGERATSRKCCFGRVGAGLKRVLRGAKAKLCKEKRKSRRVTGERAERQRMLID